jgi:XTP/dITP diphosphohydrolase
LTVYCATTNPGKLREFRQLAGLHGAGRLVVDTLPDLAAIAPPEETGTTFEANAVAKALGYGRLTSGYLFVDDSGLEVDALGGAPGVYSARFAGPDAGDEDNNRLLLERMRGVSGRAARYVAVVAVAHQGQLVATFRGVVEGLLTDAPRGNEGFGYDPLFYYPPFGCTFGEAPPEMKAQVSHRASAVRQMMAWLAEQA